MRPSNVRRVLLADSGIAAGGYAFYSAYTCMVVHSPTALSSVVAFGDTLATSFLVALLIGRTLACACFALFPSRAIGESLVKHAMLFVFGAAVLGFTMIAMILQLAVSSPIDAILPWMVGSGILLGLADMLLVFFWLSYLTSLTLRNVFIFLLASVVAGVFLYYLCTLLPAGFALPASFVFFFLSLLAATISLRRRKPPATEYSKPVLASAVSRLWRPIFGVSVLAFMAGLVLQISGQHELELSTFQRTSVFANEVVYLAVLAFVLAFPRTFNINRIYQIAIPLSAVGFLLLPLIWNAGGGMVNAFVQLGYSLAMRVLCCLIVETSRDTALSSYRISAIGFLFLSAAQLCGTLLGFLFSDTITQGTVALTALALASLYLLSCVSLFVFKDRSFRKFDDEPESAAIEKSGVVLESRCSELAESCGFTPREKEIFVLLGQGNTIHALSERLFISESTVKFHVKSIYQKLDIHTRQELIDLINLNN